MSNFTDGLKQIGTVVAKFAPLLGEVIPLPGARLITDMIAKEFGASDDQDLISKINNDPNAGLKLVEIQSNTKVQLQSILANIAMAEINREVSLAQSEVTDRISARETNVKNTKPVDSFIKCYLVLALTAIIGYCVYGLLNSKIEGEEVNIIYTLVGSSFTLLTSMVFFYWGTSFSSSSKDDALISLSKRGFKQQP